MISIAFIQYLVNKNIKCYCVVSDNEHDLKRLVSSFTCTHKYILNTQYYLNVSFDNFIHFERFYDFIYKKYNTKKTIH